MSDLNWLTKNLEQFGSEYEGFNKCVPLLSEALSKALGVPKITAEADYYVLALAKLCVDRFQDVVILCSQGRGDGAMPLVRAMFEGLVNASYLQAHPEKAEDFKRYMLVYIDKVQRQIGLLNGKTLGAAEKKALEDALLPYLDADGKITGPKHDWTEVNLVARAQNVNLEKYVALAYYRTLEIAHPSMIHVFSLSKIENGERVIFGNAEEFSKEKVKEALSISHFLAIEVLVLLNKTFGDDDLKPYIANCSGDYSATWKHEDNDV